MFNLNSLFSSATAKTSDAVTVSTVKAFKLAVGVIVKADCEFKITAFERDGNAFLVTGVTVDGKEVKASYGRTEKVETLNRFTTTAPEVSMWDSVCDAVSTAYDYTLAPVVDCCVEGWEQLMDMDKALDWKGCLVAVASWFLDAIVCAAIAYFFPAAAVWLMIAEICLIAYKAYRLIRRYGLTNSEYLATC